MTVNTLKKAGAIMRYRSPYRNSLREGFYDREGYLNGIFATPLVFIFNTKLVSRKEVPTTIEELLNPNWSGKMAVDDESFDWLAALLDYYGEAKGLELATKLGRQKLNVRRGPTLLTQLVAAVSSFWRLTAITRKPSPEKGRERRLTRIGLPEPFVPAKSLIPIYMSSRPPHPHAAALIADFLMSKKGQEIMSGHGRWVGYKGITAKGPDEIAIARS